MAYALNSETQKTAVNTGAAAYTTQGTNKYIYIRNNGTQNLNSAETNGLASGSYLLDDMHIIFYDISNNPIGELSSGYIPDQLTDANSGIYRIQVPNDAVYFRITNGTGKLSGTTNYNLRQSEVKVITPNGLYKFVDTGSSAADYITTDSTVPANAADRENPQYLLTLVNEKTVQLDDDVPETSTYDIKLATVVTNLYGTQKYIEWLKQKNGEVDQEYLNHTNAADVGESKARTTVKVVKDGTYYWVETKAPDGYELNKNTFEFIKTGSTLTGSGISGGSITVTDKKISGKVILTKTAKEKSGTYNIGDKLEGAEFKLVKINSDSTEDASLRFTESTANGTNTYSISGSGSYNQDGSWLTTGADGEMTIQGLAPGDYYLEEQTAPIGYSNLDSNNSNAKKKVSFSVGDNTTIKNLTCSDEMNPAYIQLYEHINEWCPSEWGNPTFIFKITQKKYADDTDVPAADQTTHMVALTVDENGKWTEGLSSHTSLAYDYTTWFEESTLEGEYKGVYHIDAQGRIRLEPGTYEITRMPVSRYKFVENTWKLDTDLDSVYTGAHRTTTEALSVKVLAAETAIVHYYDIVEYYDKFSQVDTEINKFYKLNESTRKNETVKGIRVEYNGKAAISGTAAITTNTDNNTAANSNTFNAWFINVDGTEREMTASEKAYIVITDPNNELSPDFSFDSNQISVSNASTHANNVYTLTATYNDKFSTTFDLVFSRT